MLSKLSSLSIASLPKLDEEADKFYDGKHDLYHTALLTRCYTQHDPRPGRCVCFLEQETFTPQKYW